MLIVLMWMLINCMCQLLPEFNVLKFCLNVLILSYWTYVLCSVNVEKLTLYNKVTLLNTFKVTHTSECTCVHLCTKRNIVVCI